MKRATCCDKGNLLLRRFRHEEVWGAIGFGDQRICFCPWCGHDLSKPAPPDLSAALLLLLTDNPLRLVFDVDGTISDDSDPSIPYDDRPPYPWVSNVFYRLKAAGHKLILHTARHMKSHGGDPQALRAGKKQLELWLVHNNIPFDEVVMGKPSASAYVDDKAFRIRSNDGERDWLNFFASLSQEPPDASAGG